MMLSQIINLDDIPSSISEFFTPEQFAAMSEYEKKNLSNLRQNYETFCRAGFPAQLPDFMLGNNTEGEKDEILNPLDSSDVSDPEWTPALEKVKNLQGRPSIVNKTTIFRPPKKVCPGDSTEDKLKMSKSSKRKRKRKKAEEKNKEKEVHEYPFRKKRMTSYMCVDSPDDDDFLYCEECNEEYDGDCPVHGPLILVNDAQVPQTCTNSSDEYCRQTIPDGLVIKKSKIPKAGLGVFAVKDFPARTRFGPYRGKKEIYEEIAHESGYSWQVMKDGRTSHFVDGRDPNESNWMRFVNCARNEDEQCVTAYQYRGDIYYRSDKHIFAGAEILVYYGDSYAKDLGVQVQRCRKLGRSFQARDNAEDRAINAESDRTFSCNKCQVSFSQFCYLQRHMRSKHNDTYWQLQQQEMLAYTLTEDQRRVETQIEHNQGDSHVRFPAAASENNDFIQTPDKGVSDNDNNYLKSVINNNVTKSSHGLTLVNPQGSRRELNQAFNIDGKYIKLGGGEIKYKRCVDVKTSGTRNVRDKPYKCDVCSARFNQSGSLVTHKRVHTGEKPYKCHVCSACFTTSGNLETHKRVHTGEKPYKCDVCSARFTQNGDLKTHKRVHTGEKPYKCDVCSARLATSGSLETHKRVHTGEKPYKCDVCNTCFTESSNLKTHKRVHTGEKPYKCDVCSACFTTSGNLETHKRVHTGEKPYKCDVCSAHLTTSGSLETHKRVHTGEKPYKCDVCSAGFTQSCSLKQHCKKHTGHSLTA